MLEVLLKINSQYSLASDNLQNKLWLLNCLLCFTNWELLHK